MEERESSPKKLLVVLVRVEVKPDRIEDFLKAI